MYNEARNRATQKYHKAHLEQVAIRVQKGRREEFKKKAEARGLSLAAYICALIDADDLSKPFPS